MQSRYAGSALGALWAYIQPLLTVGVYFLVFDIVFDMRMGNHAPTDRVGTYLVVGAIPWLAFSESLSRAASSLVEAGSVLQKNALPSVLFVVRSVLSSWLSFVPVMLLLAMVYGALTGHWFTFWILPVLLMIQLLLTYLCGHVLAILTAATRDTTQLLGFTLSVGVYLSPVLFPLHLFPAEWQWVLFLNPMSSLVLAYQSVMLSGVVPAAALWGITFIWLAVLALILDVLISRSKEELVDWL